jgi:hypothetical protein
MVGCELADAPPLQVRVVALVGGWMAIVSGDDTEVVEPVKILPGGFWITVGAVGDRARRRRVAGLQDGPVDSLFGVVAVERIIERWRAIGGVCFGHTLNYRIKDIFFTSVNSFLTWVGWGSAR